MKAYILVIYFWSGPPVIPEMSDFPDCFSAKKYYESIYWQDKQIKEMKCVYMEVPKK